MEEDSNEGTGLPAYTVISKEDFVIVQDGSGQYRHPDSLIPTEDPDAVNILLSLHDKKSPDPNKVDEEKTDESKPYDDVQSGAETEGSVSSRGDGEPRPKRPKRIIKAKLKHNV